MQASGTYHRAIAHKFKIGNDVLNEYDCDISNSERVIKFGNARVPYTLFRSTVNLICPVICSVTTTVGPGEEAVFLALLDAAGRDGSGESLFLEPRRDDSQVPILGARVFINYNSAIVPVAFINLTNQSVVIKTRKFSQMKCLLASLAMN